MNNSIKCISLVLIFAVLFSCSSQEGNEGTVTVEENEQQLIPVVDNLPEYPVSELPEGLVWLTNDEDPVFSDPNAKPGGTYRSFMMSFPLTLRTVGPDSTNSFAYYVRALSLSLVDLHPITENFIPSLATHWAYGDDNKTIYFKLDPNANWSDGNKITADDYLYTIDFMLSEYIVDPWYNNYYSTEIAAVRKYDDHTISVTGGTAKPKEDLMLYYGISPTPRHFHKLDEKWITDFNWEIEPVTGPYTISMVEKGKFVEFSRNKDWWAKDLKYNKNRFNVDKFRITVIRDLETAYRHFLRNELDTFGITAPNFWYEKTNDEAYQKGYINRIWFYNDIPQPTTGMTLNMDNEILSNKDVRYGIAHSLNFDKMINSLLRGDYERMHTYSTGFGKYSNYDIRAREYDLDKADMYFSNAGWDNRGPDGIRVKDDKRLSFIVSYAADLHTDRLTLLKEEAKKAGLELELRLLDPSTAYKLQAEKKHQIAWSGLSPSLRPQYFSQFHSENAHKTQTNNTSNTDDREMDELIIQYRNSSDGDDRAATARKIQEKIYEIGAYVPSYYVPYIRQAYWRWNMLPKGNGTKLSDDMFDPLGSGLFWIDDDLKQGTLEAMKTGKSFEPVLIKDETYKVNL